MRERETWEKKKKDWKFEFQLFIVELCCLSFKLVVSSSNGPRMKCFINPWKLPAVWTTNLSTWPKTHLIWTRMERSGDEGLWNPLVRTNLEHIWNGPLQTSTINSNHLRTQLEWGILKCLVRINLEWEWNGALGPFQRPVRTGTLPVWIWGRKLIFFS